MRASLLSIATLGLLATCGQRGQEAGDGGHGALSPRAISVGLLAGGIVLFVMVVMRAIETGPGSGFKGYTTTFRFFLRAQLFVSLALVAAGAYGLYRLR